MPRRLALQLRLLRRLRATSSNFASPDSPAPVSYAMAHDMRGSTMDGSTWSAGSGICTEHSTDSMDRDHHHLTGDGVG